MKRFVSIAAAFAAVALWNTGAVPQHDLKVAAAKSKLDSDKDGIPQVVFADPPKGSVDLSNWHRAPEALEQYLAESQANAFEGMAQKLAHPAVPSGNIYNCLITLQEDTPVYQAALLAQMYNQMVDFGMPGYANRPKLRTLTSEELNEQGERLELKKKQCLDMLPPAAPEFDPAYNNRNEMAVRIRTLGFKAVEQMGYAMIDQSAMNIADPKKARYPDGNFCGPMMKSWNYWDTLYNHLPEGGEKDSFEPQIGKMQEAIFRICPGPFFR